MKNKIVIALLICFLATSFMFSACASEESALPSTISWATLSVGATNYQESVGMSEIVNKYTPMTVKVEPTIGETVWIPGLGNKEFDVACQSVTGSAWAFRGLGPWDTPQHFLRLVLQGAPLIHALVTTKDSGIKSWTDLRGKKIGHPVAIFYRKAIFLAALEANGLTEADVDLRDYTTIGELNKDLIDGRLDAICWALSPFLLELEAAKGAYIVPLSQAAQDNVLARVPGVGAITSQEGLYGMPASRLVFGPGGVYTYPDQREDVIYEIVKAVYENSTELATFGPTLKDYRIENYNGVVAFPYHSGAVKYYKDNDVWTSDMQKLQDSLLSEAGADK